MLDAIVAQPPDPLLKVMKAFREDSRAHKIDLGVGVYRDETGLTPVMRAVKEAERRMLVEQTTKVYVGQQGDVEFLRLLGGLVFGAAASELVSIQSVGGTGALRLGCDLLRAAGGKRILLPTPSWPNHPAIIAAAGLIRSDVAFFNLTEQRIEIEALLRAIAEAEPGDAVLLQGCCHNPLGADFTQEDWTRLAAALAAKSVTAFIDLAYVGFGDGVEQDVIGVRHVLDAVPNVIVALSCAKNFGLYRERVGALYVRAAKPAREAVASNLYAIARANYSMPPDHGALCVRTILGDPTLAAIWRDELDAMRIHMQRTRANLAAARVNAIPMSAIAEQKGMFSTLPLTPAQVMELRERHGIYMTDSARINVAGLRQSEFDAFIAALNAVA